MSGAMSYKGDVKICGNCKYFEQGEGCSFCGHPEQKDNNLKRYTYWPFGCSLFTQGIAQSRINFMKKNKSVFAKLFK